MDRRFRNAGLLAALLVVVSLAGCSDSAPATEVEPDGPGQVKATKTTGGIRGVVVDQSITPIAAAKVTIKETGAALDTDDKGMFIFNDLTPGLYTLEATKPLYDQVQVTTQVVAAVSDPDAVKIQLTRLTDQTPRAVTNVYDGYLFCSINVVVPEVTYLLSEECGEGVGVDGVGRVGGNENNVAQIDFYIESADAKTMMAEVVWDPSIAIGVTGAFNMGIYTDFLCNPSCGWDKQIDRKNGNSPLILRSDDGESSGQGMAGDIPSFADAGFTEETVFSTFTWASSEESGVLLEQPFKVFQTTSYLLPLPETWSYVNGDTDPFTA